MPEIDNMREVLESASISRQSGALLGSPSRETPNKREVTGTLNTVQRFLENIPDYMSVRDVLDELTEFRERLMLEGE